MSSAFCWTSQGADRFSVSMQRTVAKGSNLKTDNLHPPGTDINLFNKCIHLTLVRDHPQMKANAFFHTEKKKKFYVEVLYPIDINFTFYRTVNELGSIIHTLNKNSQIPASSKIPAKAIGKNFHHNS